jgi:hypothetical protein
MVIKAHKILIASAIVMFSLYGFSELRNYSHGDASALSRAGLAGVGVIGFSFYLRSVYRQYRDNRD